MKTAIGWFALILGILALAPSVAPGAMSLMGLVASLFALILSLFSVSPSKSEFFKATLCAVLVGLFLVNDTLRIFGSFPNVSMLFKAAVYGVSIVVILVCIITSMSLSSNDK